MSNSQKTIFGICALLLAILVYSIIATQEVKEKSEEKYLGVTETMTLKEYAQNFTYAKIYKEDEYKENLKSIKKTITLYETASAYEKKQMESYSSLLRTLGVTQSQLGLNKESLATFQGLVKREPDNALYIADLAVELGQNAQREQSIELVKNFLKDDPLSYKAKNALFYAYFRNRDFIEAYALGKELISSNKTRYGDFGYIVAMTRLAGSYCKCVPFDKELEKKANRVGMDFWGSLLANSVKPGSSLERELILNIKTTTERDVQQGRLNEAFFYLGSKYEAQGDVEKAKEYYQEAIRTKVYAFTEYGLAKTFLEHIENNEK